MEIPIAGQIANFYSWALGIGGLVALGVLIFAGILYTTSAGNQSRQDDAKQWITGALVGLLLLFGSFLILNTINPELTILKNPLISQNEPIDTTEAKKVIEKATEERIAKIKEQGSISPTSFLPEGSSLAEARIPCTSSCSYVPPRECAYARENGIPCDENGKVSTGSCGTKLNPVLINNLVSLQSFMTQPGVPNKLFVTSSVCGDHAEQSCHYRKGAVDISISGLSDDEIRNILIFLAGKPYTHDIWAPSRFSGFCMDNGIRGVACNVPGHEDHIHYDVGQSGMAVCVL